MDAHQTSVYATLLISSIIIGIIIVFFIVSIIHHQRRSQTFYKLSIEAEITTLERERSRMAADLHDELGPLLSAIKFRVGSLDINAAEDEQTIEKINEHIDTMVQRMREISNDLMPHILVHKGVVVALRDFIDNLSKPASLSILFAHQDIPSLPLQVAVHIYRIVLEIIHNTIKHAHANTLKIEFRRTEDKLLLYTRDDGDGFDYNLKTRETNRLGLRNLLSRSEMLSASLFADTARGKGTAYIIEIPFNPAL